MLAVVVSILLLRSPQRPSCSLKYNTEGSRLQRFTWTEFPFHCGPDNCCCLGQAAPQLSLTGGAQFEYLNIYISATKELQTPPLPETRVPSTQACADHFVYKLTTAETDSSMLPKAVIPHLFVFVYLLAPLGQLVCETVVLLAMAFQGLSPRCSIPSPGLCHLHKCMSNKHIILSNL